MNQQLYCGNNNLYGGLVQGTHRMGGNYECLQKGIGIGLNLPVDMSYSQPYQPIDPRKFYCGEKKQVPLGYFSRGSPSICIRKGVGVGKATRVQRQNPVMGFISKKSENTVNINYLGFLHKILKYILPVIIIIIIIFITFFLFYGIKPKIILQEAKPPKNSGPGSKSHKKIDWEKFIVFFILTVFLEIVIVGIIWLFFVIQ